MSNNYNNRKNRNKKIKRKNTISNSRHRSKFFNFLQLNWLGVTAIVTLIIISGCMFNVVRTRANINEQRVTIDKLNSKIIEADKIKANLELEKKNKKEHADEYIEKVARDILGFVKEDDLILKPEK